MGQYVLAPRFGFRGRVDLAQIEDKLRHNFHIAALVRGDHTIEFDATPAGFAEISNHFKINCRVEAVSTLYPASSGGGAPPEFPPT